MNIYGLKNSSCSWIDEYLLFRSKDNTIIWTYHDLHSKTYVKTAINEKPGLYYDLNWVHLIKVPGLYQSFYFYDDHLTYFW